VSQDVVWVPKSECVITEAEHFSGRMLFLMLTNSVQVHCTLSLELTPIWH